MINPEYHEGSWLARFRGGPVTVERVFAVGPIWQEMRFAQVLRGTTHDRAGEWYLVGGDGIPEDDEDVPWEGEIVYRLAEVAPGSEDHDMVEAVAFYEVEG